MCDGCKLAVHQGCYGAGKDTQQGGWRCRPCTLLPPGPERDECRCVICGKTGGALKPTEGGEAWAHLWCVWWDPNAYIEPDGMAEMEPVCFTQPQLPVTPSGTPSRYVCLWMLTSSTHFIVTSICTVLIRDIDAQAGLALRVLRGGSGHLHDPMLQPWVRCPHAPLLCQGGRRLPHVCGRHHGHRFQSCLLPRTC